MPTALVIAALVAACAHPVPDAPGATTVRVTEIRFLGVAAFDARDIADALATREYAFNPFARPAYYNRYDLAADVSRIETWYQERGYFDARVADWGAEVDEERERAVVTFEVVEGEPSFVTNVEIETRRLRQIRLEQTERDLAIRAGDVFSLAAMNAARDSIREELMEHSYALADVEATAWVNRVDHTVEIYFFVDPGPSCLFGEIIVEGNRRVPDELIRSRIRLQRGQLYHHSWLALAERQLYDLNAFSFVSVQAVLPERDDEGDGSGEGPPDGSGAEMSRSMVAPGPLAEASSHGPVRRRMRARGFERFEPAEPIDDAGGQPVLVASLLDNLGEIEEVDPEVPVRITVVESPFASYRAGGGFGIESGRTETYLRANAIWRNLVRPLNRLELDLRAGWVWIPKLLFIAEEERLNAGPIGSLQFGYSRPRALFSFFDTSLTLRHEEGIEPYYTFARPGVELGLRRRLSRWAVLDFGYALDIQFTREDVLAGTPGVGELVLPPSFRTARLFAEVQFDRRDDPLQPSRGLFVDVSAQISESWIASEFPYLRVVPEFRAYREVGRRLVIAGRLKLGSLVELSGAEVPRSLRFSIGGGDSLRGFPDSRLTPYEYQEPNGRSTDDPNCLVRDDVDARCSGIGVGGHTAYLASLEPRFEIGRDWLFGALFLDAGGVGRDSGDWSLRLGGDGESGDGLHAATGGGLRIVTPIGPVRFDLGYRLTDATAFAELRRLTFHLAVGEAF